MILSKPHLLDILTSLLPLAVALLCALLVILAIGENPLAVASVMLRGSIGSARSIANTLEEATPLLLTGLCVMFAMRAGLFNIGGEGQLVVGGFVAAWIGVKLTGVPMGLHIAICLLGAGLAGAIWATMAGGLRARFGAHEVITTIMLNYIAMIICNYLVNLPYFKQPGQIPKTFDVAATALLPRLTFVHPYTRLNAGLFVAIGFVLLTWLILERTSIGYEITVVGLNPDAARVAGMRVKSLMVIAMAISGFLAGLAGAERVMGVHKHFVSPFPFGYGFSGIAVALLGKNKPLGVVLGALFFGALMSGGAQVDIETGLPREIVTVIQAVAIMAVAGYQEWRRSRLVRG